MVGGFPYTTNIGLRRPTEDRSLRTIKCRTTYRPICQYGCRNFVGDDRVYICFVYYQSCFTNIGQITIKSVTCV